MNAPIARIKSKNIHDWKSFNAEFDRVFGFPEWFTPRDQPMMDGWIDFMSSLDNPDDGMTNINCKMGGVVTIQIDDANDLKERCPTQFEALLHCSAFVNWRRIEVGESPVIALSYNV